MKRHLPALIWLWCLLTPGAAFALPPQTQLDQLHHNIWTIENGAPADVWALDQGPDGYLWLGTGAGLFRFDGSDFERIVPERGDHFPSIDITALKVTRTGDVWLGYSSGGISRLRAGELVNYEGDNNTTHWMVLRFVEDRDGTVWAATERGLMRFDGASWQIIGKDWNFPGQAAMWVETVPDGSLWVGDGETILYLEPGQHRFVSTGLKTGRAVFAADGGGSLWVLDSHHGLTRIAINSRTVMGDVKDDGLPPRFNPNYMIVDRDGVIWGTDLTRGGIFRITDPGTLAGQGPDAFLAGIEKFGFADGLSSNISVPLLADHSDQLWVGTNLGLDRFSRQFFVTEPRISATSRYGYKAIFTDQVEYILDTHSVYRLGAGQRVEKVAAMPGQLNNAIADRNGALWAGTWQGLWRYTTAEGFKAVPLPEGTTNTRVGSLAEDKAGILWIIIAREGVFRLLDGKWDRVALPTEIADAVPGSVFADPDGAVWMGLRDGRLLMIDGIHRRLFDRSDGLDIGEILGVHKVGNYLFAIGAFGIARREGDRFNTVSERQLPSAFGVTGITCTPGGQVWLNTISGVVRIAAVDLEGAFKNPEFRPASELFTARDGLPGVAQQSIAQTVTISRDGRIWFTTNHGMAWHDLSHEGVIAPTVPVRIKTIIANGVSLEPVDGMVLPTNTSQLSLSYQALNLVSPERTQFRYRLGGPDEPWVDVDTARLIQFSNLGPGQYHLALEATSEAGVWHGPVTHLSFRIPPTFIQSRWFLFALLAAGVGIAMLAYLYHLRQVAMRIKSRMEERVFERERIARDLHDTLLQGFQGLVLRFQSVLDRLPVESDNRDALEAALERADDVLQEGRDRVRQLRRRSEPVDLPAMLEELASDTTGDHLPWQLEVRGTPAFIAPHVAEEMAPIASEALCNAVRHAHAGKIMVRISFSKSAVALSVIDDGVGIDDVTKARGGQDGHYGLVGMHERAAKLRGRLDILDGWPTGTEIRLTVPGGIAFAKKES